MSLCGGSALQGGSGQGLEVRVGDLGLGHRGERNRGVHDRRRGGDREAGQGPHRVLEEVEGLVDREAVEGEPLLDLAGRPLVRRDLDGPELQGEVAEVDGGDPVLLERDVHAPLLALDLHLRELLLLQHADLDPGRVEERQLRDELRVRGARLGDLRGGDGRDEHGAGGGGHGLAFLLHALLWWDNSCQSTITLGHDSSALIIFSIFNRIYN